MDLASYQRTFMRVSFAAEPDAAELSRLGSRDGALLYRHMIRTRLLGMAKVAFKGCSSALGEDAFGHGFSDYLAGRPPQSALIRDVIADFAPFALADQSLLARGPAFLADLVRFEELKWRLAYAPSPELDRTRLRELDFVGAPLWNPLFRSLVLSHPVHVFAGGELSPEACELFVYRPPGSDEVRWYKSEPFFAALLHKSQEHPDGGFGELVPSVAEERSLTVDQGLLESLATSLTLAVERGVLLGVLDRS
jgi:hypothetical protein